MADHDNELSRRDVIKLGAAATVAASLGVRDVAAQARVGGFLTESEFATLDELSDMIIPTDAQSPGARAAKVAAFIDSQLAEAWEEKDRTDWRAGLGLVERLSQDMHGTPFMKSSTEQRLAVLTRMAQNEAKPEKPEEQFFTYLTEFAGYDD